MKFVASFSGGKDSYLSIYRMIQEGNELVGLIVSTKENGDSWTHNLDSGYFEDIAKKFNCKVYFTNTNVENYEKNFEKALIETKKIGSTACVFGDIDNELHLNWNRDRCKNAGIECIMPLMNQKREDVVEDFLKLGIKAVVVKIDESKLDKSFLGRIFDKCFIEDIKRIKKIDLCGENGEYHTKIIL